RKAYALARAKVLFHNSVDLNDIEYELRVNWDGDTPSIEIDFTAWNIGATTTVGKPAFADAHGEYGDEVVAALGDEVVAALEAGIDEFAASLGVELDDDGLLPAIDIEFASFEIRDPIDAELTASLQQIADMKVKVHEARDYIVPEPEFEQPIKLFPDGTFCGHLGVWGRPHRALRNRTIPRSATGYSGLLKPGPYVQFEDGRVEQINTAPIFLKYGHPKGLLGSTQDQVNAAYGDTQNAWGDYTIVDGKIGPWMSGKMRDGLSDDLIHAAQCSPISGHWLDFELAAVVSVNTPANEVRSAGSIQFAASDDHVELVASFAPPEVVEAETEAPEGAVVTVRMDDEFAASIAAAVKAALQDAGVVPADAADDAETDQDLADDDEVDFLLS
ncbi:MAG: hypothetical protein KDB37_14240, partial [Ilumatobacter sp.]|nr:hypothetical protein [Ilumatobacter sp.]